MFPFSAGYDMNSRAHAAGKWDAIILTAALSFPHLRRSAWLEYRMAADVTGDGLWTTFTTSNVPPGKVLQDKFPAVFGPCRSRLLSGTDTTATAQFR